MASLVRRLAPIALTVIVALVAACTTGSPAGSGSPAASAGASAAASVGDPTKDELAHVLARGRLIGYAATDYPPQSMLVEGATSAPGTKCLPTEMTAPELTGFDVETTKLVAKGLGVEACFATPVWPEVTAGNWSDRWDIAYGSGSINADRMTRLWMTQPYYGVPNHYFVRTDSPYRTPKDLEGKQIGACSSCSHEAYLKHELQIPGTTVVYDVQDPRIVAFETEEPGLRAVADGEIDAYLAAAPVGDALIKDGLDLRRLDAVSFTYYPSGFVDKGSGYSSAAFVGRVNEIIRSAQADGSLRALSMEWFGEDFATAGAEFDLDATGQQVE